jgi:hypothetical protein
MTRRGRVLWENQQSFTFREAFVTHDGNAVGYAYTNGLPAFRAREDDELVFALLGSDGTVWAEEHTPFVTQFGFQPHPRVSCFLPCPDLDLVVLEVFAQPPLRSFEWWVHSLTSGACLEKSGTRPRVPASVSRATYSRGSVDEDIARGTAKGGASAGGKPRIRVAR